MNCVNRDWRVLFRLEYTNYRNGCNKQMRATITEADADIRQMLVLLLEREGIRVTVAHTLEDISSAHPNIVMLDRAHGLFTPENMTAIRHANPVTPLIVALDANHGFVPQQEPQVDVWLPKPFTAKDLKRVITSAST